ncbi:fatty acid desaturase [Pseudomonas sp. CFBP 13710]|uniref:fatty acid desaturase n=1 Tax=Pseudomonas sp. CFBP 13710 TaxID=2775311 RepID=UPI0017804F39|nr:fatty acid desaturase [Pseudomonas sp. CFBP 13710]MBD8732575.1 fatty acid desaturase [Pseudomonas sp. CFBP 13710]
MPNYLDSRHRQSILKLQNTWTARSDWPTWLLLLGTYGAWWALIEFGSFIGRPLTVLLLVPLLTLWMSLQHELLHGHPTRWRSVNKVLGYAPLAIWYPYTLYRDSHLAHHRDETITLPRDDPESRYLDARAWSGSAGPGRTLHWLNKTLLGRLCVGPALALAGLIHEQCARLLRGEAQAWLMWGTHLLCVLALFGFISAQGVAVFDYLLASILALALSMIRSYYEHRPAEAPEQRSVLNEAGWPWRWLFLNLNLHLVHHDLPGLPWYYLPRVYRERRADWLQRSGHFLVNGYSELFRRYAVSPVDSPLHPRGGGTQP